MTIPRWLSTYRDGFRVGRLVILGRFGRARDRSIGLGLVLRREPFAELVLTVGPWAASMCPVPIILPRGDETIGEE